MISENTKYGEKEEDIVMSLIDEGYNVVEKEVYYVGGGVQTGVDTYINLSTNDYSIEPYEWVEHGKWKVKYIIKKRK